MDPKKPTQSQTRGTESKQSTGTGPNPSRFLKYEVLPDESGFRIPNCDHIFEFDTHGGWFDEYDNYYNADGQPATPPEYDDDLGDFDDIADALAKEYDMYDDEDGEEHLGHYDNIYLNIENKRVLQNYLQDQEINIEIRNMNFNTTENDFENFLHNKKIEFIEFEFEYDNRDRFRGVCYVTLDKPNAEKLIEFNGTKFSGRDIKINVLKPEEEEEADVPVVTGGEGLTAGSQKQEEQKSQWRAPVEKPKEESTTSQPQTTTQTGPAPVSNQNQSQGRFQNQNQNFQKGQGYNQSQGSRQNYQQNRGNQQNQYQKQGQSGIQRNYGGQSQQYQQNQYSQQNPNYQNQKFQGYSGGQNYPYQYQNQGYQQGGYQQQWGGYGAPQNQYPVQGGYPQQNFYGGMPQGQYFGQPQGYYQQGPGFAGQSGGFPSQGGQAQDAQGDPEDASKAWGKPLKKKEQGK